MERLEVWRHCQRRSVGYRPDLARPHAQHEGDVYKATNHGFHDDTTPRYDEVAAKEAWQRTLDWFNQYLRT